MKGWHFAESPADASGPTGGNAPSNSSQPPDQTRMRGLHALAHLFGLAGFVVPYVGGIIGPLLVWQLFKRGCPSIETHAKTALSFQLTMALMGAVVGALGVLFVWISGPLQDTASTVGFIMVLGGAYTVVTIYGTVVTLVAVARALQGKPLRYPLSIPFLRSGVTP